jgi:hypothetical protein
MQNQAKRRSRRISSKLAVCWLRGGKEIPALVADINLHGMFIRTELDAWRDELLEVIIQLGDGPLRMCVVARFMGNTDSGRGIGAELFLVSKNDRRRWSQHYHATLRKLTGGARPHATEAML